LFGKKTCYPTVSFVVCAQPSQTVPDESAIQSTVVNTIHAAGFTNNLAASVIIRAVQDLLPTDAYIEDFVMTGSLLLPSGETVTKTSVENLEFYEPPYATAKTISFFCDLNSVFTTTKTVTTAARFL
jgi:F420-dependent methylenetetrahydromethanopterin dehydrogenase